MERVHLVDLVIVKVPKSLSDLIPKFLAGVSARKLVEMKSLYPIHDDDLATRPLGIIIRKIDVIKMTTLLSHLDGRFTSNR